MKVHVCSFQDALTVTAKTTYEELKRSVLEAGRFSAFEARENPTAARMFTRLCRDIEVITKSVEYPWTIVKLRKKN